MFRYAYPKSPVNAVKSAKLLREDFLTARISAGAQPMEVEVEMAPESSSYETVMKAGIIVLRHQASKHVLCSIDLLDGCDESIDDDAANSPPSPHANGRASGSTISFVWQGRSEQDQATIRLNTPVLLLFEDGGQTQVCEVKIKIICDKSIWERLKSTLDLPEIHVRYADFMADIINTPYASDLDKWIGTSEDDTGAILSKLSDPEHSKLWDVDPKDVKRAQTFRKHSQNEARCTIGFCCRSHPWAVRGTLHTWSERGEPSYGDCKDCGGTSGKDGGLFAGETVLHIAIVQRVYDSVKWLLDRGASVDNRAVGVFFKPANIPKFKKDHGFWERFRILLGMHHASGPTDNNEFYSGCQYGEYPLSFAVAVGHKMICNLLLETYRKRLGKEWLGAENTTRNN